MVFIAGNVYLAIGQTIPTHHKSGKSIVVAKTNTHTNYRRNANAGTLSIPGYCPTGPVALDVNDAVNNNTISNGATLTCASNPFNISADNSFQIVTPCIQSGYTSSDILLPNNGTETGYEAGVSTFCLAETGCVFPIGDGQNFLLNNYWGLQDIYDDPSKQHYYNFCYNGLTLVTTTIQLQDCWSGNSLSAPKSFTLNLAGNHCFTDTVSANTPIGMAIYTIAPSSGTVALTDYHNGEAYINPAILTNGSYTVTYSFRPPLADSCPTITGTFNFNITSGFTVHVNSPTICAGANTTLTASSGTTSATYSWSPSGSLSSASGASVTATPSITSMYTVTGTHTGCAATSSATSTVTVNTLPTVTVNSVTVCAGKTATLTTSGATTYSWTPATGLSSTTGSMVTGTPTLTTNYTVSGTSGGCTSIATSTITVNPIPTIAVNNAAICTGGTATLTASGAATYSWNPSSTSGNTLTATPSSTTVYTVTGTSLGCSSSSTSTVTVNPTPTITVNSATVCAGTSATLTASGATTYTWSPSSTSGNTLTVTPTSTSVYSVTGTSLGCFSSVTSTVLINPLPIITVNNSTICIGGTATLTANGASTYTWNTSSTGATISPSPTVTTNYTVTGTDPNNCKNIAISTVTINSLPNVSVNSSTICIGAIATLTANGVNTYTWNTSATGATISPSPTVTTNYTVTGTDINNCKNTATSTITVNSLPNVSVNSSTICIGATASLTASGANTYTWNTSATGATISPSPTVNTNYTVTGTDINNCKNIAVSTVTVNSLPNISVNSSTICIGAIATLTANGANTYTWNTGATGATISPSPSVTTNYTITGTDINNCINNVTSTVTVNSLPIITVNSATICLGNSAALTASGASTYTWNTSATGATISPSPTVNTNYTVTGTGINNCKNTGTSTITVTPSLVVTVNSATICVGATTTLTANGASTYSWAPSMGLGTTNTVTANPTATTVYTVTGTTGVCSGTATSTVIVNSLPNVGINSSTICIGATATLTASGANTYTWNTSVTGATINPSPSVTTNYMVIGTDANNCKDTSTSVVIVNMLPTITVNSATICVGSSATLTANGANTYVWSSSATGATISPSPTTVTVYTVTGTNANNCINTATSTVIVNPLPIVTVNNATICGGANATLTATGANTYIWNTSATGAIISVSPTVTTNYTVTGADINGCINESVSVVNVNTTPNVIATGSSSVCVGQTINLSGNTFSSATYLWNGPNGFTASSQNTSINNAIELNAGTYTLSISLLGCSATNTVVVIVDSIPTVAHAGMDTTIYNSSISLTGNVPVIGSGVWSVVSGSGTFINNNSASTTINNLQTGQNILQWTITNGACPISFDDIIITVNTLVIPNGFSPNGDGMNDYFEITGIEEYSNVKLNVFNRWENQVYESDNYKNDWNGKNMSGENVSDDTYFYTIEIPGKNKFKGYVVLKRK